MDVFFKRTLKVHNVLRSLTYCRHCISKICDQVSSLTWQNWIFTDEDSKQEDVVPEKTTRERWEESVLFCSSLAQVFLHLSTLEKSIIWQKSALHARCRICRRKGDAEQMLLCDKCDRGHHMYCLKPRLKVSCQCKKLAVLQLSTIFLSR